MRDLSIKQVLHMEIKYILDHKKQSCVKLFDLSDEEGGKKVENNRYI